MNTPNDDTNMTGNADNGADLRTKSGQEIIDETDFNGIVGTCRECGSPVADYNCNGGLIAKRPEGGEWDWWVACTNPECKNHHGEGIFMHDPDWLGRGALPTPSDTPETEHQNRGGEIWEKYSTDKWREMFAEDVILRLQHLERQLNEARRERDEARIQRDDFLCQLDSASRIARDRQLAAISAEDAVKKLEAQLEAVKGERDEARADVVAAAGERRSHTGSCFIGTTPKPMDADHKSMTSPPTSPAFHAASGSASLVWEKTKDDPEIYTAEVSPSYRYFLLGVSGKYIACYSSGTTHKVIGYIHTTGTKIESMEDAKSRCERHHQTNQ